MHELLYQVMVETTDGNSQLVGPRMIKPACEQFVMEINKQIAMGREKDWSNPAIVPVPSLH